MLKQPTQQPVHRVHETAGIPSQVKHDTFVGAHFSDDVVDLVGAQRKSRKSDYEQIAFFKKARLQQFNAVAPVASNLVCALLEEILDHVRRIDFSHYV